MAWIWGNRERLLTSGEQDLIQSVFGPTALPPLSLIRIRNGLSTTGVPFTTLGSSLAKLISGYPFRASGQYQLMVGPDLFERDLAERAPSTLIHEMTHVWQYKHETLTELRGLAVHAFYYLSDKVGGRDLKHLYSYTIGQAWNEMSFEGQAQLVQDWYSVDRMRKDVARWAYVSRVVQANDVEARQLPLEALQAS